MRFIILLSVLFTVGCAVGDGFKPSDDLPFLPTPTQPGDSEKIVEANVYTNSFHAYLEYFNSITETIHGREFGPHNRVIVFSSTRIPFEFIDLSGAGFSDNTIGVCWYLGNGARYIQYDRESWEELSPIQRESLVFHENGHCKLSRDHRCSFINSDNFSSIMYPSLHITSELEAPVGDGSTFWTQSRSKFLLLELFDSKAQYIDDCSTSIIKHHVTPNGDVAHPFYKRTK